MLDVGGAWERAVHIPESAFEWALATGAISSRHGACTNRPLVSIASERQTASGFEPASRMSSIPVIVLGCFYNHNMLRFKYQTSKISCNEARLDR
jgi:hypothetical protein